MNFSIYIFAILLPTLAFSAWPEESLTQTQQLLVEIAKEASASKDELCLQRYDDLYTENEINITIGMGYFDNELAPAQTLDPYMHKTLLSFLTAPCRDNILACGFSKEIPSGVLSKAIKDHRGRNKTIKLRILSSSYSYYNFKNTNEYKEQQISRSQAVRTRFYQDMQAGNEVVFYIGHSRKGGGPDFFPPKILHDNHVDYGYYDRGNEGYKQGFDMYLETLDNMILQKSKMPKIVGFFSCSSREHFLDELSGRLPKAGFIFNKDVPTLAKTYAAMYGALDSILGSRCKDDLVKSIGSNEHARLYRFFRKF